MYVPTMYVPTMYVRKALRGFYHVTNIMYRSSTPHESWKIENVDWFGFKTPLWVAQEAYNRLYAYEECEALADHAPIEYRTWLLAAEDPCVKALVTAAEIEDFEWGNGSPSVRPSLLLLNEQWLANQGYSGIADMVVPQDSEIFRDKNPLNVNINL